MSKFYRVILGIAGVCLILGITICIIVGVSGGWSFVRNGFHYESSKRNNNYDYENIDKTFDDEITSLEVTIPYGEVTIKQGEKFSLVAEDVIKDSFNETTVDDGILKIEQKYDDNFLDSIGIHINGLDDDNYPKITITIPEGFTAENFKCDFGAGKIDISDLKTEYTSLELGAGDFSVNNLTADKIDVDGGVGKVQMENVSFSDLNLDTGVGLVDIQGKITGNSTISAGVGQIIFDIDGNEDDYYIDLDTGVGEVRFNGSKINSSVGSHSAENQLVIDAGVGQIEINIE